MSVPAVTAVTRLRTCSGRDMSLGSSSSTRRATSVPGITCTSTRVGPVWSRLCASGSEMLRENWIELALGPVDPESQPASTVRRTAVKLPTANRDRDRTFEHMGRLLKAQCRASAIQNALTLNEEPPNPPEVTGQVACQNPWLKTTELLSRNGTT